VIINSFASNAKLGTGDYMLAEADESDKSFLMLQPSLEIITNIDADHLVNYKNNMNNLEEAFIKFVKKLPFNGLLVACGDDPIIKKLVGSFSRKTILYGFEDHNDYIISNYKTESFTSEFTLSDDKGSVAHLKLNLPGKHNVLNATAASVLAIEEGVSLINIKSALEKFSGIRRRMEFLGKLGDTVVIDDYGHHPTEIKNTILTLRESFPRLEITMVFQPHRFSRTKDLYEEFVEVLQLVEGLILLEIYSAGEKPIDGISSSALLDSLKDKGLKNLLLANSSKQALELINSSISKKKEVLLIQGAGNISDISKVTHITGWEPQLNARTILYDIYKWIKENGTYKLIIKLPFAMRKNIELNRISDELIVRIGSVKRHFLLPRQVTGLDSVSARLDGQSLYVIFKGDGEDEQ
jgi:UDP-N-acetylmuramate--alanine ligase